MLGARQEAAARELAQWWEAVGRGGVGSHAVLLVGPAGWGRSTVLDRLAEIIGTADAPPGLLVRVSGRSVAALAADGPAADGPAADGPSCDGPAAAGPGAQDVALRDRLLGPGVRRQAAELLCRSRLRGIRRGGVWLGGARPGGASMFPAGLAGTISLLLAGLAAAAAGGAADDSLGSVDGAAARAARVVAAVSASAPVVVLVDDADILDAALVVNVIENLIDHHDSRILVVAAVDLDSDLAAALTARAQHGLTAGKIHRAGADPRMGLRSRTELAGELCPHLTPAGARQLARQTRTFAEVFAAARSEPLPDALDDASGAWPDGPLSPPPCS